MAKRVMREFTIAEISAVDRPAQKGARMVLMKRDVPQDERDADAKNGLAMPDGSFPIKDVADLKNAIQAYGRAKDKAKAKAHIMRRAKALGASDQLPDAWDVEKLAKAAYAVADAAGQGARSFADLLAENEQQRRQWEANEELWPLFGALQDSLRSISADTAMNAPAKMAAIRTSVEQFMSAVAEKVPEIESELEKALLKAGDGPHQDSKGDPDMSDLNKVAELEKQLADVTKRAETAEAEIARLTKAAEIAKNDETFSAAGVTIRKSEVGDTTFAFMKAQQERIEIADYSKRAETEIGHLPGETVAKAKVLRAIDRIGDADVAKALGAMLAAGQQALKMTMVETGHARSDAFVKAEDELAALAQEHVAKNGGTLAQATDAVLRTPRGRELYNEIGKPKAA